MIRKLQITLCCLTLAAWAVLLLTGSGFLTARLEPTNAGPAETPPVPKVDLSVLVVAMQ